MCLQQNLNVRPTATDLLINQEFSNFGASDEIVARTSLQTRDLIGSFPLAEEVRNTLVDVALTVQKRLVACQEIALAFEASVDGAIARLGSADIIGEQDESLVTIPGVPDLEAKVEMFLYQAKLAIRDIGQLYEPLVGQHFGQNFKEFADWAAVTWGEGDLLVQMLQSDRPWIGRVISFRDAIEHPKHRRGPLAIRNFTVAKSANGFSLIAPSWGQGGGPLTTIGPEMRTVVNNLLTFYEELLAGLLMKLEGTTWLEIIAIPEAERDPAMPVRFRVVPRWAPPEA